MDTLAALFAKMDERLAKQDEMLTSMHQHLAHQDAHLAQQAAMLAQLVTLTDIAREEATAVHHAMAVALTHYAETRLDIDRFITTAERVLAAWERHSGTPT